MAATAGSYAPELPVPIINRIQTVLNPKQAAQTTLVSKSWRQAWWTRPTIDLDESHFPMYDPSRTEDDQLMVFATKTFRRYKDNNLRIDTFSLCLTSKWYCLSGLATNWTSKALKLGATDFTFRFQHRFMAALPMHAVLESENIVGRLCVEQACIDIRPEAVRCTGLKSLALSHVEISSDSFFNLISCCSLIESLSLSNVGSTATQQDVRAASMISLPNLTSLTLFLDQSQFIKTLFLDNLSSKFPSLKDLTLNHSKVYYTPSLISNDSLEILNLIWGNVCTRGDLEIDAPMLRKFTFEASFIPRLSFRSKPNDLLECHVSLTNNNELSTSWFYKLSEFLTSMAGSDIRRLCLHLHSIRRFHFVSGDIERFNVCKVEDLTMDMRGLPTQNLYAFLDILFRICHPKTITQYMSSPEDDLNARNNDETLCRILEPRKDLPIASRFKSGSSQKKLKKLNYAREICNDQKSDKPFKKLNRAQNICNEMWKAHQFDSVLEYSTSVDQQKRFRFQLTWKASS